MLQRTFGDGYLAGWQWVRGEDQVPTVPTYSVPEGEAQYWAGVMNSIGTVAPSARSQPRSPNKSKLGLIGLWGASRSDSVVL